MKPNISYDDLFKWYERTYPDDDQASGADFWLYQGYERGFDECDADYPDVWDALAYSDAGRRANHANGTDLRRFARGYAKGKADRATREAGLEIDLKVRETPKQDDAMTRIAGLLAELHTEFVRLQKK